MDSDIHLRALHDALKEVIPPDYKELLLCGSRLGGWCHEKSDYDVLVLYPYPIKEKKYSGFAGKTVEISMRGIMDYDAAFHGKYILPKQSLLSGEIFDWYEDEIAIYLAEEERRIGEEYENNLSR